MIKEKHVQCKLRKKLDNESYVETTTFLPAEYALLGSIVKLKQDDDSWSDGWEVIMAGGKIDSKKAIINSQKWKWTRKHSDI